MPELPSDYPKNIQEAKANKLKELGHGKTWRVYDSPKKGKVIGIIYRESKELPTDAYQIIYHGQKILHSLYPEIFPSVHAVFTQTRESPSRTIREKVKGPTAQDDTLKRRIRSLKYRITGKWRHLDRQLSELNELFGKVRDFPFDMHPRQIVMGSKSPAYVDIDYREIVTLFQKVTAQGLLKKISNKFGQQSADELKSTIERLYAIIQPKSY